jgi:hypothetical protein
MAKKPVTEDRSVAAKASGGKIPLSPVGYASTYTSDAAKKASAASDQTPFLGQEGEQIIQTTGGATQLTGGILRGSKKDIKEGASNLGKGILSAVTAEPLRSLNKPPPQQFSGGSPEALAANRAQYDQGILSGYDMTGRGEAMAGVGINTANAAANMGGGLYNAGMGIGASGIYGQGSAIDASINAAQRDVGSVAAQQQKMANDDLARRMMGQASAARGGNQAAAMRNAQGAASQNALVTNQQIGLMRLQEEQAKRAGEVQAQQFAAGQYGDRAALGYGTANQGAGQVNTAGSTIGGIGGNIMDAGNTQTKTFVDAETEQNKAQLDADTKWASAKKASQGGVGGVVKNFIGGLFALTMAFGLDSLTQVF